MLLSTAAYIAWRTREGCSLKEALEWALRDLDGFYTFLIGTRDGFAVVRDPIACKHAVMAETDDWVAMASEYRAIAVLPGAADAVVWEPEPAQGPAQPPLRALWQGRPPQGLRHRLCRRCRCGRSTGR